MSESLFSAPPARACRQSHVTVGVHVQLARLEFSVSVNCVTQTEPSPAMSSVYIDRHTTMYLLLICVLNSQQAETDVIAAVVRVKAFTMHTDYQNASLEEMKLI